MFTVDGLRSLFGKFGEPGRDKAAGLVHSDAYISDEQLAAAYRTDFFSRKIVDIPADDALRKWRTWGGEFREAIESEEERLDLQRKTMEAVTMGRLYGGAALFFGVTDQEAAEPLDIDAVGPGGVEYVTVLTRRELRAGELERDPRSPYHGRPHVYTVSGHTDGKAFAEIHPSRLAIFGGDSAADKWGAKGVSRGWTESVLVAPDAIIKQTLGTFGNVASLVHEANVDAISIPDLAGKLDMPGGEEAVMKRLLLAALGKGVSGMLVLDSEEEYVRRSANFSQAPELMEAFSRYVAAAADIPATRFLSQSPAGLVATGEHDMENYFSKIAAIQRLEIKPSLRLLDRCLVRSATGDEPEGVHYEWAALKQLSEKEAAELGKITCESLQMMDESGHFTTDEMRELYVHKLAEVGAFAHLPEIIERTKSQMRIEPMLDFDETDSNEHE